MVRAMPRRRPMSGFTITEVLVVVVIVAILAAVAGPDMITMVRTQRVKTATFDLFSSLNVARSEAIKRNVLVTMTPTDGGNWAKGWRIVDANNNRIREQSGWDTLTMTGPAAVTFTGAGRLPPAGGAAAFSVTSTDLALAGQRCVRLDLSGRAVSQEGPCT